jgi:hypothetical protein
LNSTCRRPTSDWRNGIVSDERLEKLGKYFCHFDIRSKYGISFERFLSMVENGTWSEVVR